MHHLDDLKLLPLAWSKLAEVKYTKWRLSWLQDKLPNANEVKSIVAGATLFVEEALRLVVLQSRSLQTEVERESPDQGFPLMPKPLVQIIKRVNRMQIPISFMQSINVDAKELRQVGWNPDLWVDGWKEHLQTERKRTLAHRRQDVRSWLELSELYQKAMRWDESKEAGQRALLQVDGSKEMSVQDQKRLKSHIRWLNKAIKSRGLSDGSNDGIYSSTLGLDPAFNDVQSEDFHINQTHHDERMPPKRVALILYGQVSDSFLGLFNR